MSQGKFSENETVRVKRGNPKIPQSDWGAYCLIVKREDLFVRKIFRTDYQVVMLGSLVAATFKEDDLERP